MKTIMFYSHCRKETYCLSKKDMPWTIWSHVLSCGVVSETWEQGRWIEGQQISKKVSQCIDPEYQDNTPARYCNNFEKIENDHRESRVTFLDCPQNFIQKTYGASYRLIVRGTRKMALKSKKTSDFGKKWRFSKSRFWRRFFKPYSVTDGPNQFSFGSFLAPTGSQIS